MTDDAPKAELILYQTEDGRTRIECRFEGATCKPFLQVHALGEPSAEATIRRHRIVRANGNRSASAVPRSRGKSSLPSRETNREAA